MRLFAYWKIVAGLLVVFAAGAVTGSVGTHQFIKHGVKRALNFEHWKAGVMQSLQTKLKLTAEQHQRIENIVENHGREIHGCFAHAFGDSSQILVRLQKQIDQQLTPEQRAIHAQMKKDFRAELKKRFNFDLPEE
jgi:Spy/CpxP family protein refolding chaperone